MKPPITFNGQKVICRTLMKRLASTPPDHFLYKHYSKMYRREFNIMKSLVKFDEPTDVDLFKALKDCARRCTDLAVNLVRKSLPHN